MIPTALMVADQIFRHLVGFCTIRPSIGGPFKILFIYLFAHLCLEMSENEK